MEVVYLSLALCLSYSCLRQVDSLAETVQTLQYISFPLSSQYSESLHLFSLFASSSLKSGSNKMPAFFTAIPRLPSICGETHVSWPYYKFIFSEIQIYTTQKSFYLQLTVPPFPTLAIPLAEPYSQTSLPALATLTLRKWLGFLPLRERSHYIMIPSIFSLFLPSKFVHKILRWSRIRNPLLLFICNPTIYCLFLLPLYLFITPASKYIFKKSFVFFFIIL